MNIYIDKRTSVLCDWKVAILLPVFVYTGSGVIGTNDPVMSDPLDQRGSLTPEDYLSPLTQG